MKFKKILSASLCLALVLSCGLFSVTSKAQTLKEDNNPKFNEYLLDGVEPGGVYYKPEAEFVQDQSAGHYSIDTNANVLWWYEDGAALLCKKYALDYGDLSTLTVEATVKNLESTGSASAIFESASAGIIIRNSEANNSPYVFLHVRRDYIWIVYRTADGNLCEATTQRIESPVYPIKLKMVKSGNAIACYAQNGNKTAYTRIATVNIKMNNVVLAGLGVHSCQQDNTVKGTFEDVNIKVEAPDGDDYVYNDPDKSGGKEDGDGEDYSNEPYPDPPIDDTSVLLRETFTDGSLINTPETVTNPVWGTADSDAALANIICETEADGKKNRVLHRKFSSGYFPLGNKGWTDYSLSVDLKFGEDTNLDLKNEVDLYVRYHPVDMYGYFHYRVALEHNKYIRIYKMFITYESKIAELVLPDGYIADDWVTWTVDAFDNKITVYRTEKDEATGQINKVEKLSVTDDKIASNQISRPYVISKGRIAIGSEEADVFMDNIIVRKLEDLLGGDYDNEICGNWDQPKPDYLSGWK